MSQTLISWPTSSKGDFVMPGTQKSGPIEILLVEDSPDDAELMKDALENGSLTVHVYVAEDGEQALSFLQREEPFSDVPKPNLVLLDLHLPKVNGHEVLAHIKADLQLRRIPVVIFTSSERDEDFSQAYDLLANCCIPKPIDIEEFADTVTRIEQFWLHVASRTPNGS